VSDDGRAAIVVIALVGSPFSPAYARARARGQGDALGYCALNVALYGPGSSWWSLRERALTMHDRGSDGVVFGSSTVRWSHDALVVTVDERTTPFSRPIRGTITLRPQIRCDLVLDLDRAGAHRWWPVAPLGRIEVALSEPNLSFRGHGYHDANAGDVPLEATFDTWRWSRARSGPEALLTYAVRESDGTERGFSFGVGSKGEVRSLEAPWAAPLPRTHWGLERSACAERDGAARVVRTLEDGPFYARALVETRLGGRDVLAMHEVLAAARLRRGWVRFLTGFRMRRAA
jgi:carotenoid 1,2-hydratase